MKGEAICDGEPALLQLVGKDWGRILRVWSAAWERDARLADRFPGPHSGAERLPNLVDGSALAVVNAAVGSLRRQASYRTRPGNNWGTGTAATLPIRAIAHELAPRSML